MGQQDEVFTEIVLSTSPLCIRRRVRWGECDPAGVVYTPRFADYATEAALWFMNLVLRPALPQNIGSPMKGMRYEFHRTLKTDELFDMRVALIAIRQRTFDLEVKGADLDGVPRFSAVLSPILIDRETFTSVPIPIDARRALERYRAGPGAG